MSADLVVNLAGLLPVRRLLNRLSNLDVRQLLDVLGSEGESQTRRRIDEEKTSPDGEPWSDWSEAYAAARPAKGGLLELGGDLRDSLTYEVGDDAVTIGSNLVYAATHNEGDAARNIPERRYLGVSDDNLDDLGELTMDFLAREARS